MLVFIDESGDQGLLNRLGTSPFFVIAAVIFLDHGDAFECARTIADLRRDLLPEPSREFKFNKCARTLRCSFFESIEKFDFLYVSVAIDKKRLMNLQPQMDASFYRYACKLLLDVARPYINDASVVIDGSGERRFRRELQNYLKLKANSEAKLIRNVRMESSMSNNLLQLADMVCGAVARSFRSDKDDQFLYRTMLLRKELDVVRWPKK
jgi:hypothetical protein